MSVILIADDDPNLRYSFRRTLQGCGHTFLEAEDGPSAIQCVSEHEPDLTVLDVRMPGMSGLEAFEEIKRLAPSMPVIIMTAFGTTDTAIEAMKQGAFDYVLKPFDVGEMKELLDRALRRSAEQPRPEDVAITAGQPAPSKHQLVGSSRAMQRVYKAIGQVAPSDVPVLILGETGTGKELVARAVHHHGTRRARPFIAINCAAIPEPLIEGELFGHEKGAFTGADHRKLGLLHAAQSGTVFLDEIAEIPAPAQAKLLRFLQDGEVIRLGSDVPVHLDARVVAATNRDLAAEVDRGRFREDLYYRLNALSIHLPPLRDRLEDLEDLVAHFVARFNERYTKCVTQISSQALSLLRTRGWPGNVRELENLTRKAVIVGQGPVLQPDHFFPDTLDRPGQAPGGRLDDRRPDLDKLVRQLVDSLSADHRSPLLPTVERLLIERVYQQVAGNQVQAAKRLGISRNTLRNRLERYKISLEPSDPTKPGI